jgi:hypothetical protein
MAVSSSLKRVLIFLAGFAILNVGNATQVMQRPANVSAPLHKFKLQEKPIVHSIHRRATSKVSMGAFSPCFWLNNIYIAFSILYQLGDIRSVSACHPHIATCSLSVPFAETSVRFSVIIVSLPQLIPFFD